MAADDVAVGLPVALAASVVVVVGLPVALAVVVAAAPVISVNA